MENPNSNKDLADLGSFDHQRKEDHSIEEYHEFSVLLEEQYQNIFKVCKMSGAAHDELHKMLVKMNFFIQKMSSEDLNEIKRGCDQLHKQLHLYNVYFE